MENLWITQANKATRYCLSGVISSARAARLHLSLLLNLGKRWRMRNSMLPVLPAIRIRKALKVITIWAIAATKNCPPCSTSATYS